MNVLSLFDGISCWRVALERAGIKVDKYFASEIDKYAIQVSTKNYPDIVQLWDVNNWKEWDIWEIDMIMWGSPCQNLSVAWDQTGLEWDKSKLFYTFVDIVNHYKPKYFLLENVKMKKEWQDIISKILWVEPICIDSSLVSAQSRKRLYRTNIQWITQPKDKEIMLKDILLPDTYTEFDKSYALTASYNWAVLWNSVDKSQRTMVWNKPIRVWSFKKWWQWQRVYSIDWKSVTLSALWWWWWAKTWLYLIKDYARKLEPIECERLQTLPDNFTEGVGKNQRRKMLWNWWTVDVVTHILSFLN